MKRLLAFSVSFGLVVAGCGGAGLPGGGGGLKIGMVTDIGQLEDKSFNEFTWKGVQDGAKAVGAPEPKVIVTKDVADYKQNIQQFVDQKFDVIVTTGFLIGTETTKAATANPGIQFFGIDQFVCVPKDSSDKECKGNPANYQGLLFNEAQAGYLAGIVAATITKSNKIGAVGGQSDVPPVVAYIKGYENAAKATKPGISVSVNYVESFIQDVRYGLRMLAKNPGFTAVAIITFALGIGANTAIFTLVNTILLHPLPYPDSGRIVDIFRQDGTADSLPMFSYWQLNNPSFDDLAAYGLRASSINLRGGDRPEMVQALKVSVTYFRLFGAIPILLTYA